MVRDRDEALDGRSDRFTPPKVTGTGARRATVRGPCTIVCRRLFRGFACRVPPWPVGRCSSPRCGGAAGPTSIRRPPRRPRPRRRLVDAGRGTAEPRRQAVRQVLAQDPRFAGIGPTDPNLIGQSAWYEVSPAVVGWRVTVTEGVGRLPGRLHQPPHLGLRRRPVGGRHPGRGAGRSRRGRVRRRLDGRLGWRSTGSPPVAIPAEGGPWIAGRAVAGPVCPWSASRPTRPAQTVPSPVPARDPLDAGGSRGRAGHDRRRTARSSSASPAAARGPSSRSRSRGCSAPLPSPWSRSPDGRRPGPSVIVAYDTGIR